MVLSDEDKANAEAAISCCICQGDFTLYDKVYNRPVYYHCRGWSGGAKVLGKLPVPGRPTI